MSQKGESERPLRTNAIESNPRFPQFAELYVQFRGNGRKAALAAGYPTDYANSHSHELVARLKLKTGPVLRSFGFDEVAVARKLKQLLSAKTTKWNQATKKWDSFDDSAVQLAAVQLLLKLLEMEPPKRLAGNTPDGCIPIVIRSSIPRPERAEPAGSK